MIDPIELAYHAARTNNVDDYDAAAYAIGFLEPNYPMPAIRYRVTRGGRHVKWLTIVNRSKPIREVVVWWERVHDTMVRVR